MRTRTLRGVYRPSVGILHTLPLGWKTLLLFAYIIAVLNLSDALALATFILVIGTAARLTGTSAIGRRTLVLALLAALFRWMDPSSLRLIAPLLFALARVSFLSDLIRWYGESIHYSQLFALSSGTRIGREILFFIASGLTAFPLIERDLHLALDAERLRLGHLPRLWMIGTWVNLLTNVLVRGLERAYSVAHNTAERGFSLETPFTTSIMERISATQVAVALIMLLPPLIVLGVEWLAS